MNFRENGIKVLTAKIFLADEERFADAEEN